MKYFVTSDIHSFYDEFIQALDEAGYDKNNENHTLIVCGDIFDRGTKPLQVYEFLRSIPKERRILIRGNHEYLLKHLMDLQVVRNHDIHNRTNDTLAYLNNMEDYTEFRANLAEFKLEEQSSLESNIERMCEIRRKKTELQDDYFNRLFDNPKAEEILKWIFSDEWVNYYELDKFIFVHSFIPITESDEEPEDLSNRSAYFKYNPDWRTSSYSKEWYEATWGCPYELFYDYFDEEKKKGKVLVCGHWHTFDFFQKLCGVEEEIYDIYYDDNLIALDACTAYSHQCNVMVIDEDMKCYQHNKLLKPYKVERHLN